MKKYLLISILFCSGSFYAQEASKSDYTVEVRKKGIIFRDGLKLAVAGYSALVSSVLIINGVKNLIIVNDKIIFVVSCLLAHGCYKISDYSINSLSTKEGKEVGRKGRKIVMSLYALSMVPSLIGAIKYRCDVNRSWNQMTEFDIIDVTKLRK